MRWPGPLTGDSASAGQDILAAARVAAGEVNAADLLEHRGASHWWSAAAGRARGPEAVAERKLESDVQAG